MPPLSLMKHGSEIVSAECKALLHPSRHGQFRTRPRNSVVVAEHPHGARSVIDLENARSHCSISVNHASRDGNLTPRESSGIAINFGNAFPRGTSRKQQRSHHNCRHRKQSCTKSIQESSKVLRCK